MSMRLPLPVVSIMQIDGGGGNEVKIRKVILAIFFSIDGWIMNGTSSSGDGMEGCVL